MSKRKLKNIDFFPQPFDTTLYVPLPLTPFQLFKKQLVLSEKIKCSDIQISISWNLIKIKQTKDHDFLSNVDLQIYEIEPEFKILNDILELYCSNISFIKYKRLLTDLTEVSIIDEGSYNESDYLCIKLIKLENLFNWLINEKLINIGQFSESEAKISKKETKTNHDTNS